MCLCDRIYTQYSVVVQAFNKVGPGPTSEETRQYTAEGIPEQPPQDTTCTTLTSQTIRVSWVSPPLTAANGIIKGYKVVYGPSDIWYGELHMRLWFWTDGGRGITWDLIRVDVRYFMHCQA